ncbi:MAG: ATP-binding cassette domain-containing protein [bacterium]|nr:ATP-binding cassette domain-containing protein [bacterium]MDE0668599.1 ATP-binding cassette domain-containing protein [bacterium]
MSTGPMTPALRLSGVGVVRDRRPLLTGVNWTVQPGERWVVLGPNGAGKSTLLRVASLYLHPTEGTVEVLGRRLGRVDVRRMRHRVGYASAMLSDRIRSTISALDAVVTARHGALEPWWHSYSDADRQRAADLLERMGCGHLAAQQFGLLSSGERQRVQIARTLMTSPGLVLLDEPTAALDLAGREELVRSLDALSADPTTPPTVLVTHHVEEIPAGFDHALLLRGGRVVGAGPIEEVLTAACLSACFSMELELEHRRGRWWAHAAD